MKFGKFTIGKADKTITKEQAKTIHNKEQYCNEPYLVKKPSGKIEYTNIFGMKYFTRYSWECLNCNWESEKNNERKVYK